MKTKVRNKSNDLGLILETHFRGKINLARIKFIALAVMALCKVQTVNFERLSQGFDSDAQGKSSLRRIQRFMAKYVLDMDLIARMVFSLLPHKPPYRLLIDRTNWKFEQANLNILVLAIAYKGVSFPILYRMLPKSGGSHTDERIEIIEHYIALFGKQTIKELLADREFVGEKWFGYLNSKAINYYIRVKGNYQVMQAINGKWVRISWLFENLKIGQTKFLTRPYYVTGKICYLSASCIVNDKGRKDLLIIASFNKTRDSMKESAKRWQIESMFKAIKSSGFNIEKTHLADIKRFEKLLTLVFIAFLWAYLTGLYIHNNIRKIRLLKYGVNEKSFFKYGLEYIAHCLLNPYKQRNMNIYKIL